jgi:hypothetical protein
MARRDIQGVVDFDHLETYAAHDAAVIDEVLALFREQAGMWLKLMDPEDGGEGWRDGAHTLKGASLGVGAFELADACAEAEAAADAGLGERAVLYERVRTALDAALVDIAAYAHEQMLKSLKTPRR